MTVTKTRFICKRHGTALTQENHGTESFMYCGACRREQSLREEEDRKFADGWLASMTEQERDELIQSGRTDEARERLRRRVSQALESHGLGES